MNLLERSYRLGRAFSHVVGKERVGQGNVHEEEVVQRGRKVFADAGPGKK